MHGTLGDIWIFNTGDRTWITPVAEGKPPCPREMHTGTMITDGRMLVFGGRSPAGQVISLFDSPTCPWMMQLSRSSHCAPPQNAVCSGCMIVTAAELLDRTAP